MRSSAAAITPRLNVARTLCRRSDSSSGCDEYLGPLGQAFQRLESVEIAVTHGRVVVFLRRRQKLGSDFCTDQHDEDASSLRGESIRVYPLYQVDFSTVTMRHVCTLFRFLDGSF